MVWVQFWTKQPIIFCCQPYVRKPGKDQACSSHHPETLPNSRGRTGFKTRSAITSCCWNEFDLSQMNTCIGIKKRERKQRRRGRQRKRPIKSNRFRLAKQQLCTCITLFVHLYISLPPLHDNDEKNSNFTFCVGREHKTVTSFFCSWTSIKSFRIQLQKKIAKIGRIERDGISSIVRIHFLEDVFEAVAIDSENCSLQTRLHSFLCWRRNYKRARIFVQMLCHFGICSSLSLVKLLKWKLWTLKAHSRI